MKKLLLGSRVDRLLLAVSMVVIAASWFVVQSAIASGPSLAEVYHGKTLLATYPLPAAGELPIRLQVEGSLGSSEIMLDENGARFLSSPCDSKRCVLAGAHRHAGELIACIPNRILITIRGSAKGGYDAIVE